MPFILTTGELVQNSRAFSLEQSDHPPTCFNRGSCATLQFYHWCGHLQDFHYESTDLATHNVSAAKFSVLLIISWLLSSQKTRVASYSLGCPVIGHDPAHPFWHAKDSQAKGGKLNLFLLLPRLTAQCETEGSFKFLNGRRASINFSFSFAYCLE